MVWRLILLVSALAPAVPAVERLANVLKFSADVAKLWGSDQVIVLSPLSDQLISFFHLLHQSNHSSSSSVQLAALQDDENFPAIVDLLQIDGGRKKLVLSTEPLRASQLAHIADSGLLEQMEWFLPEPLDMAGVTLRLDSMLYIYKENQDVLSFQEIYAIKGSKRILPVANWNSSSGFERRPKHKYERRKNLGGTLLLASVSNWRPLCIVSKTKDGGVNATGYLPSIFKLLQADLGFRTSLVKALPGARGKLLPNGTWTGIAGMLQRKEIDVSIAGQDITREKARDIDLSMTLKRNEVGVMVHRHTEGHINYWVFLKIFVADLWLALLGLLGLLAASFLVIHAISKDTIHQKEDTERFGCLNSLSLVGLLTMQLDYPIQRQSKSIRILFLVTCTLGFIVYCNYTATLTSWMTAKEHDDELKSFADLYTHGYRLYTWKNSAVRHYLAKELKEGTLAEQLYKDTVENSQFFSSRKEYGEIKKGEDVAIFQYFVTATGDRTLKMFSVEEGYIVDLAFGFQKNSEFTGFFNHHLSKIMTSGLMNKLQQYWLNPNSFIEEEPDVNTGAIALGYTNMLFPFAILVGGLAFACVLNLTEKACKVLLSPIKGV